MKFLEKIKNLSRNKYFSWFLVIIYAGLIFYLSSLPEIIPPILEGGFLEYIANYSIKIGLAHFLEFGILSILLFRALYVSKVKNAALYAVIITVIYAISDEFHQIFVPNRIFDYRDIFFDIIGAIVAQFVGLKKILLK